MKKNTFVIAAVAMAVAVMGAPAFAEATTETVTEAVASYGTVTDPSGNQIVLPETVEKIISMAPSTTQFLLDLGLGDKIIACDSYSQMSYADQLAADIPVFDMMEPDNEQLVALAPDIIFTTGMSSSGGTDVFAAVKEAGVCVADIPSASSLAEVESTLSFIGSVVGEDENAEAIVADFHDFVEEVKAIGATIPEEEKKTVLYEISTPTPDYPSIYTAGQPTYINEMIEALGAVNVAGDQTDAWVSLTEEAAIAMDPAVILTTDVYTENVVDTLKNLSGWENVQAVVNDEIYLLDADQLNRPNQHLESAFVEIGKALYPEAYAELDDPFQADAAEEVTEAVTE